MKKALISLVLTLALVISPGITAFADDGEVAGGTSGSVTFTVEKFILGQGYITEPVQVPIDEGDTVVDVTQEVMGDNVTFRGATDYVTAFYDGLNDDEAALISPPDYVLEELDSYGTDLDDLIETGRQNAGWLTENDYYDFFGMKGAAGWMFCVNNQFPGVGASGIEVQDGDVIRWQYSLVMGMDIGSDFGVGIWGPEIIFTPSDRDDLTALTAFAAEKTLVDPAYDNALSVLSDIESDDAALAAAYQSLQEALLGSGDMIEVGFTLLGDSLHGGDEVHSLYGKNLETWIAHGIYHVDSDATAMDLMEEVFADAGVTYELNDWGFLNAVTFNGVTLKSGDNNPNSGWMYTLNGMSPSLGMGEQGLNTGDEMVLHWTDDWSVEIYKTSLYESIAATQALEPTDYTSASWALVDNALKVAQAILANDDATQEQVDAATQLLDTLKGMLVKTETGITRISGPSAPDTAAEISKATFPDGTDFVVLARDDDYKDAMSATGLAGALDAPILTTDRTSLSVAAAEEITRLGASEVYIIGGKGAITLDVEDALVGLGVEAERVSGASAADTSVACAQAIEEKDGGRNSEDTAIVATSTGFVDAISVSSYAYRYHIPILIVSEQSSDPETDRKLTPEAETLASAYAKVFVPGGRGALPESSVEDIFGAGKVERISGKTGLDTSNEVAKALVSTGRLSASVVGIANGESEMKGVDALAAASLCGKNNAPIILVDRQGTASGISGYITDNATAIDTVYLFGGKYVIPEALQATIEDILKR